MTSPIAFSEWAGRLSPGSLGVRPEDRSPCPICGHPTGDCTYHGSEFNMAENDPKVDPKKTGASKLAEAQRAEVEAVKATDPTDTNLGVGAGSGDAVVVGPDDEVGSYYSAAEGDVFVTLDRDVIEEFYYPNTTRPSHRVLYSKNQVVSKAVIDQYNADTAAAKAARERAASGELDPQNPAGIDSTTLASGTYSVAETTGKQA